MSVQDRILQIIATKGLNRNTFSNLIGVQPQTLHHIVAGRRTHPSYEVINKIISTFSDISAKWLITGTGDMFVGTDKNKPKADKYNPEIKPLILEDPKHGLTCDLCKEKDRTIVALQKTISAQEQVIESLQDKIEKLSDKGHSKRK
jgi:DNA-binding XRE family transcriptional regulator